MTRRKIPGLATGYTVPSLDSLHRASLLTERSQPLNGNLISEIDSTHLLHAQCHNSAQGWNCTEYHAIYRDTDFAYLI